MTEDRTARIKVITDSACDLPEDVARKLDIEIVPLTIRFGDEEYVDRVDLTPVAFWDKCRESKTLPETAAPSPGSFQKAYETALAEGYTGAIVLTLSSLLSATYQSATLAAESTEGFAVRVIDTRAVSMAQGLSVMEIAEKAREGEGLEELVARAMSYVQSVGVVATLDTLEHLVKGGRVGGAKALIGQVLSIKPLVELRDGVVEEAGRQRTRQKALAAIADRARSHQPFDRLAMMHGACSDEDVAKLRSLAGELATNHPLIETYIGPVVGTHGGPGIIGLAWTRA